MVPPLMEGHSLLSDLTPGQDVRVGSIVLVQRGVESLRQKTALPLAGLSVVSAGQRWIGGPQLLYHQFAHTPTLPLPA